MPQVSSTYIRLLLCPAKMIDCTTTKTFKKALLSGESLVSRFTSKKLRFETYHTVSEIPALTWNQFLHFQSVFLSLPYLQALESARNAMVDLRFATFYENDQLIGISAFQITHFQASAINETLGQGSKWIRFLTSALSNEQSTQRVLICGNAFATGEHAFQFAPHIKPKAAMDILCVAITKIVDQEKKEGRQIAAMIVKDFYTQSQGLADGLSRCGFRSFNVDHNMIMPILPEWTSFELYLNDLNTKFRTKANAAFQRSSVLDIRAMDKTEIEKFKNDIFKLYFGVHDKADYKLGVLNADSFVNMKSCLDNEAVFNGYFLEGRLVGFSIALFSDQCMDAHLVGMDYEVNKELAIYSRILYDYIALAIQRKVQRIVFGRTAGEIKSTVGALPVDLKCCIKHPGTISNWMVKLLFSYVKPSSFAQRHPYKKAVEERIHSMV